MHEAEIRLIDLVAHHAGAATREKSARADVLGSVHQDVDLATDVGGKIGNGLLIRDVEGNDLRALHGAQCLLAAKRPPRLGHADEDRRRAGCLEGSDRFLADGAAPIRHQNPPEFRIGRHLAPLFVVRHVGCLMLGVREGDRLAAFVELKRHSNRLAFLAIRMQVRHYRGPTLHPNQADPPRRALAEINIRRHPHRRFREQRSAPRRIDESQVRRKTGPTDIAGRVGECAAGAAALQDEAPFRRRAREPMRGAAARLRGRCREPRPQQRILAARSCDRLDHQAGPAMIAAPEARPRS